MKFVTAANPILSLEALSLKLVYLKTRCFVKLSFRVSAIHYSNNPTGLKSKVKEKLLKPLS